MVPPWRTPFSILILSVTVSLLWDFGRYALFGQTIWSLLLHRLLRLEQPTFRSSQTLPHNPQRIILRVCCIQSIFLLNCGWCVGDQLFYSHPTCSTYWMKPILSSFIQLYSYDLRQFISLELHMSHVVYSYLIFRSEKTSAVSTTC